jgi:hypothetical protein
MQYVARLCRYLCLKKKLRRHRRTCVCGLLIDCAGTVSLPSVYCSILLDCAGTCVRKNLPRHRRTCICCLLIDCAGTVSPSSVFELSPQQIQQFEDEIGILWKTWNQYEISATATNAFVPAKRCPSPQKLICQSRPISGKPNLPKKLASTEQVPNFSKNENFSSNCCLCGNENPNAEPVDYNLRKII